MSVDRILGWVLVVLGVLIVLTVVSLAVWG